MEDKYKKYDNIKSTLDAKHNDKMRDIKNNSKHLPALKNNLLAFRSRYDELNNIPLKQLTDEQINEKYNINQKIIEIEKQIENIESNKDLINYFLDVGPIVFEYYDNIKSISNEESHQPSDINNFFPDANNSANIDNYVITKSNFKRASILNNYLKKVEPNFAAQCEFDAKYDICKDCGIEKILNSNEGSLICKKCGVIEYIIMDSDKPSYKEPPPEVSYFAYKRQNHFNEWLSQIQGKESTDIPQNVIDEIYMEIRKERITNLADINQTKIRHYLKKLGYNKYYEHTFYIISKLNGTKPIQFSTEIETTLRRMFKEIQEPFIKVCPPNRKNFLSYSFTFNKFFGILGHEEYKSYFPLPKSPDKLRDQENIWKNICNILGWPYIPS